MPYACGQRAAGGVCRVGDPQWAAFFFKRGLKAGGLYMEAKCPRWAAVFGIWSWVGHPLGQAGQAGQASTHPTGSASPVASPVPKNLIEAAGSVWANESHPPELAWGTHILPCPGQDRQGQCLETPVHPLGSAETPCCPGQHRPCAPRPRRPL